MAMSGYLFHPWSRHAHHDNSVLRVIGRSHRRERRIGHEYAETRELAQPTLRRSRDIILGIGRPAADRRRT